MICDLEKAIGYRFQNITLLQNGLAIASNSAQNSYGETAVKAIAQAKAQKLNVYSGEKDPDFYYGDAYEVDLKGLRTNTKLYEGKKVAFFSTNCAMQEALQTAVLAQPNAYYPQPCCPSPYHAFPATLGLELEIGGDDEAAEGILGHKEGQRCQDDPAVKDAIVQHSALRA